MSKKNNIEELFKDSMDDFRVDPPKETSKKILLGLFWSNILYHYKGAIVVCAAFLLAGVGALLYFNETAENGSTNNVENVISTNKSGSATAVSSANEGAYASTSENSSASSAIAESISTSKDESHPAISENSKEKELNAASISNSVGAIKSNKLKVQKSKQKVVEASSMATTLASVPKETSLKKSSKNKIKQTLFTDNQDKGTSTSTRQKEENIGPYGYMGEVGSKEREEYDKTLNAGGFPNLAGHSEVLNNIVELENDSMAAPLPADSVMRKSLFAVDSSKIDSALATKDSITNKKKLPFTFFVGAGLSATQWTASHKEYHYSPNFLGEINVGAQYKNVLIFSGIGYNEQDLALDTRVWTTHDSEMVEVPKTYFDSTANKDSTYYIYQLQDVEKLHSAADGRSIQLNYVYLPLHLGYQYRFQNHQLMLKAGVGMHFLTSSLQTNQPKDTTGITNIEIPLFEPKKFLLDYNIQLNYGYHFTPHILIMAGVSIKQNLGDMVTLTNQNTNLPIRPLGIGGSLQFIYKF